MTEETPSPTLQHCTCTTCPECGASGTVWRPEFSMPEGRELYSCDECNGSGISEECDYCHDAREHEEALDDASRY